MQFEVLASQVSMREKTYKLKNVVFLTKRNISVTLCLG